MSYTHLVPPGDAMFSPEEEQVMSDMNEHLRSRTETVSRPGSGNGAATNHSKRQGSANKAAVLWSVTLRVHNAGHHSPAVAELRDAHTRGSATQVYNRTRFTVMLYGQACGDPTAP